MSNNQTNIKYFDTLINNIVKKAELLRSLILKRDLYKCQLCLTEFEFKQHLLSIQCLSIKEEPTLDNSVTICQSCKSRIIKDNPIRYKTILLPYLSKLSVKKFNDKFKDKIKEGEIL
jgi:5-methylcytosine-specific restriction endonuclease McrA